MSMLREERPARYTVFIGSVPVAQVTFGHMRTGDRIRSCALLRISDEVELTHHLTMSDALREMHRRLNSPSPEGANVRGMGGDRPPDPATDQGGG